MSADFSLYDILGLDRNASPDEIKSAYHAAVKKYHPDVNSAPNAQRLTAMLNEAYETLSDPQQRRDYDRAIDSGTAPSARGESDAEIWDLFVCDGCGEVDPYLRFAQFFRVWSILIYTQMKGVGGVLCPGCRSRFATNSALFSGFLGAWGFPWGVFYTIRALIASIRGGEMKRLENAQLLRHVGIAFLQRGYLSEARTALTDSLKFEKNPAVVEMLKSPEFAAASILKRPGWLRGQTVGLASAMIPIIVVTLLISLNSGDGSKASSASSDVQAPISTSADATPAPAQTEPPCLDKNSKLKGQALYDECAKTRLQIHNYVVEAKSQKEAEEYKMLGAIAEVNQANGAYDAGRKDTRDLMADAVSVFSSLRASATEPRVKTLAQRYYNCYALDECK